MYVYTEINQIRFLCIDCIPKIKSSHTFSVSRNKKRQQSVLNPYLETNIAATLKTQTRDVFLKSYSFSDLNNA
jgi:hypothetical protein